MSQERETIMLCVIAKIDRESRECLLALQRLAERSGVPVSDLYGHITLAAYTGEEEGDFIDSCREILASCAPFSVYYEKIEVLRATSIIAASPRIESALSDIHRDIAAQWGPSLDKWTGTDLWQPHTTLVYNPQIDLEALAETMKKEFSPFSARVARIEFSQVTENGYKIVDFADLLPG